MNRLFLSFVGGRTSFVIPQHIKQKNTTGPLPWSIKMIEDQESQPPQIDPASIPQPAANPANPDFSANHDDVTQSNDTQQSVDIALEGHDELLIDSVYTALLQRIPR